MCPTGNVLLTVPLVQAVTHNHTEYTLFCLTHDIVQKLPDHPLALTLDHPLVLDHPVLNLPLILDW